MDISISTICHPPYLKYLEEHLDSIKTAVNGRDIPIYLVCSAMEKKDENRLERILGEVHMKDIRTIVTHQKLTIGAARNESFKLSENKWNLFLDTDVLLGEDYFERLEEFMEKHNTSKVGGIAGGIGLRQATRYGRFEGLMDIVALAGKIKGIDKRVFEDFFDKIDFPKNAKGHIEEMDLWKNINGSLNRYEGNEIKYLQGFNQIISQDIMKEKGGFDNTYKSAEDREIAAKIMTTGRKILFAPKSIAYHIYNFNMKDILRRKTIHGEWCGKFRKKYSDYSSIVSQYENKDWARYFVSTFKPPKPFNQSAAGRLYYIASFLAYMKAGIKEERKEQNGS